MVQPAAFGSSTLPNSVEECDARGIPPKERRATAMSALKDELASLRIDRAQPRRARWGLWIFLILILAAGVGGWVYVSRTKPELMNFAAVEVEPVSASVQTTSGPSAGTPILTASGYLVARHQ